MTNLVFVFKYIKTPNISAGLINIRKHFFAGTYIWGGVYSGFYGIILNPVRGLKTVVLWQKSLPLRGAKLYKNWFMLFLPNKNQNCEWGMDRSQVDSKAEGVKI